MKNKMEYYSAIIAGTVLLGASLSAQAVNNYRITDLGVINGNDSYATDINNNRQVVGWTGATQTAFLWQNDSMQLIPPFAGQYSTANGINDAGQIVGFSSINNTTPESHAFVWENGVMQDLGTLGGSYDQSSAATAINDQGQIVGAIESPQVAYFQKPAEWDNGTIIYPDSFSRGAALDINNSSQIVGYDYNDALLDRGFIWDGNNIQELGTLGGDESYANAINELGQVVGKAQYANGEMGAFLWENGVMTDLGITGYANDINESGQIVGTKMGFTSTENNAFIIDQGVELDLCVLTDCTANGWTRLLDATAINDRGDIVGIGYLDNSPYQSYRHAFLISAVPVPAAIWLFGTGILALLGLARKN